MTEDRMPRHGSWKFPLLLLVAAAHLWLGWELAQYRPHEPRRPTATRPRADEPEVLMVLDFSVRAPVHRAQRRLARKGASTKMRHTGTDAGTGAAPAAPGDAGDLAAAPATLDLSLRPAPSTQFRQRDPLQHQRALEFQATRYDKAWISDGNLTHVVARKSMIAGVVLGVMGALIKPCTERQREQYDVECVPGQYRHPAPGE
jgi:hypothetical protein